MRRFRLHIGLGIIAFLAVTLGFASICRCDGEAHLRHHCHISSSAGLNECCAADSCHCQIKAPPARPGSITSILSVKMVSIALAIPKFWFGHADFTSAHWPLPASFNQSTAPPSFYILYHHLLI